MKPNHRFFKKNYQPPPKPSKKEPILIDNDDDFWSDLPVNKPTDMRKRLTIQPGVKQNAAKAHKLRKFMKQRDEVTTKIRELASGNDLQDFESRL